MSRSGSAAVGEQVALPGSTVDVLVGFVRYLRAERGVSSVTIEEYASDVTGFLAGRGGAGGARGLTAAEVTKAVLADAPGWAPATVQRHACSLRSFLRYCYLAGLVESDLQVLIDQAAHDKLPTCGCC